MDMMTIIKKIIVKFKNFTDKIIFLNKLPLFIRYAILFLLISGCIIFFNGLNDNRVWEERKDKAVEVTAYVTDIDVSVREDASGRNSKSYVADYRYEYDGYIYTFSRDVNEYTSVGDTTVVFADSENKGKMLNPNGKELAQEGIVLLLIGGVLIVYSAILLYILKIRPRIYHYFSLMFIAFGIAFIVFGLKVNAMLLYVSPAWFLGAWLFSWGGKKVFENNSCYDNW